MRSFHSALGRVGTETVIFTFLEEVVPKSGTQTVMPGADFAEIRIFFVPKKKNLPCSEIGKVLVKKTDQQRCINRKKRTAELQENENTSKKVYIMFRFTVISGNLWKSLTICIFFCHSNYRIVYPYIKENLNGIKVSTEKNRKN